MTNLGHFDKQYLYDILDIRLDQYGGFHGNLTFSNVFRTVPYVDIVPRMSSNASIVISQVTQSGFYLDITSEGVLNSPSLFPTLFTFTPVNVVTTVANGSVTSSANTNPSPSLYYEGALSNNYITGDGTFSFTLLPNNLNLVVGLTNTAINIASVSLFAGVSINAAGVVSLFYNGMGTSIVTSINNAVQHT